MTPFALPPDLVPQVLIEHVRVDEHSLSTSRFIAGEPVDQLADRIADHWRAQAPVLQARHGEWRIVSRHLGSRIDTVQLRATGAGSEGFASSWQPLPAAPAPAQSLSAMLPPGCEIVRQLAHVDAARPAHTLVATCDRGVAALAAGIDAAARTNGYRSEPVARPAGAAGDRVLSYRRGSAHLLVTIASHRARSAIVIHWSTAS